MAHFLSIYPPMAWIALLVAGILIGLLAGLLGVGGGIIAVPVLLELFGRLGMPDEIATPLAIGTAQASVLIASITAVLAHRRGGTIDRTLVKTWLPALMVGAVIGLAIGPFAPARLLTAVFAIVAALLGLKMAMGDRLRLSNKPVGMAGALGPDRALSRRRSRRVARCRRRHFKHARAVSFLVSNSPSHWRGRPV